MNVKRLSYESTEDLMMSVEDTLEATGNPCLANIGTDNYESCGERLRRRRNGVTWCPTHGEMH